MNGDDFEMTDRQLVDRVLEHDPRAADLLCRRHYQYVVAVIGRSWARFPYMAEEIAQATFMKLFENDMSRLAAWRGDEDDDVAPYIAEIARNLARDYRRRGAPPPPWPPTPPGGGGGFDGPTGSDGEPDPESIAAAEERAAHVRIAIEHLPDRDAEVIRRLMLEEDSVRSVARDLGVTENNLYQIKARALARLAEILKNSGFFDDLR